MSNKTGSITLVLMFLFLQGNLLAQDSKFIGISAGIGTLLPKKSGPLKTKAGRATSFGAEYERFLSPNASMVTGVFYQKLQLPLILESDQKPMPTTASAERVEMKALGVPLLLRLYINPYIFFGVGPQGFLKMFNNNQRKLDIDLYVNLGAQYGWNNTKIIATPYFSSSYTDLGIKLGIAQRIN